MQTISTLFHVFKNNNEIVFIIDNRANYYILATIGIL